MAEVPIDMHVDIHVDMHVDMCVDIHVDMHTRVDMHIDMHVDMHEPSLVPRPSPAPFSWLHTWPLNRLEKREKAWYVFYIIKPQGGLDHDVGGLNFSNYGNVPMHHVT